jgi:signal transduction histidine kinase
VSISIGYIQTRLGNPDAADKFLASGLSSALQFGEKTTISQAYLLLSGLDSMKGNYQKAFEHIKLHQLYRDSLMNIDVIKKIEAAKLREEMDDKNQRITLLNTETELKTALAQKQKQQKILAYGIIAIIVLTGSYAFYRYRIRKKTEVEKAKLKDRLQISQGLHDDIGSTLSSISVYTQVAQKLSDKNSKEELQEMLGKIKVTSSEMISEMNDIVWTIHPKE